MATTILRLAFITSMAMGMFTASAWAETRLMMAEEPGCVWCTRWHDEIGPIYPKTGEGAAAPLRRVNLLDPFPADIVLHRRVNYTPTFILLIDGVEQNRIEGYPGDDFFWGLLGQMLTKNDIAFTPKGEKG